MKKQTLKFMPYASAYVMTNGNTATLISYKTTVAEIKDGWLEIYGLYSATTRRHIGAFMKEFVKYPNGEHGTYQDAKHIYERGYRFNIETGEIEFLA